MLLSYAISIQSFILIVSALLRYVNCQVVFSANPVTLSKGQRPLKQRTLAAVIKVYNYTKFEEIQYNSTRKTANVQILDIF